eukprot:1556070-Amphidinium_carterae.2
MCVLLNSSTFARLSLWATSEALRAYRHTEDAVQCCRRMCLISDVHSKLSSDLLSVTQVLGTDDNGCTGKHGICQCANVTMSESSYQQFHSSSCFRLCNAGYLRSMAVACQVWGSRGSLREPLCAGVDKDIELLLRGQSEDESPRSAEQAVR